jgi:TPP-dependent pyruvate/acetoin dehydrogenase alpha subunit
MTKVNSSLPDSGARSEFETGAVRDAMKGKGRPSLIPIAALRAVARRFEDGAEKYQERNWEKGIPLSRFIDSLYRHLWAYMEGDESEDHLGAIIWNAMCLAQTSEWIEQGLLPDSLDDIGAFEIPLDTE